MTVARFPTLRPLVCRFAAILICLGITTFSVADDWPSWRGPNGNGTAAATAESKYPTTWSTTENVAWKFEIPGQGASTPAVWHDQIFLTAATESENIGICVDTAGKQQWQVALGNPAEGKHKKATGANSSPVTDGEHVFFYFKSGDFACVDMEGKIVWHVNLEDEFGGNTLWWDLGTSPVLAGDNIIVACQQDGPSFVAAFDKATGKSVWKQSRVFTVPKEADQSYTTPVVDMNSGTVFVLGADHVTAHQLSDGKETWRYTDLNPEKKGFFRSISSPVLAGELLLAPYARGKSLTAIRLGGSGDITDTHVAWTFDKSGDVPTPAVSGDRVFIGRDEKTAVCLDIKSGKEIWEGTLDKRKTKFSASPSVADGKVYFTREDGTTFVVKDADEFELLATNVIDELTVATPVLVDGKVLQRTLKHLYCFEAGN